jgi:hypothetical protein
LFDFHLVESVFDRIGRGIKTIDTGGGGVEVSLTVIRGELINLIVLRDLELRGEDTLLLREVRHKMTRLGLERRDNRRIRRLLVAWINWIALWICMI